MRSPASCRKLAPTTRTWVERIVGIPRNCYPQFPDASVNLVLTSPPFALQRKKEYGNRQQNDYIEWLAEFAAVVHRKLKQDGSFVLDLGGAYQKGIPARSLYNFRIPIHFCDKLDFYPAEDFYWFNPSKLPSPIEWVNKRKIRAKDAVNTIWWFSKTEYPKADVTKVLVEYGARMKKLLENPSKFYAPKERPSSHNISGSFGKALEGAIPSNLLQIANTESNSQYIRACKAIKAKHHPARFPVKLPEFFIRFLTEPGDLVVDIFSGSNATGWSAEGRSWVAFDTESEYVATSAFRFLEKGTDVETLREVYENIIGDRSVDLSKYMAVRKLL